MADLNNLDRDCVWFPKPKIFIIWVLFGKKIADFWSKPLAVELECASKLPEGSIKTDCFVHPNF